MNRQKNILENLLSSFSLFVNNYGFGAPIVISDKYISDIYCFKNVHKNYAIQLEINWQEFNLSMFVVNTVDGKIPEDVIYCYDDGKWCRKYLEEVYGEKSSGYIDDQKSRYSESYLYNKLEFYKNIIKNRPSIIDEFIERFS